jgi:high-affinity nickel-transport protein
MPSFHLTKAKAAAQRYHGKIPYIRKLPVPVVGIIVAVVIANIICWAGAAVLLV